MPSSFKGLDINDTGYVKLPNGTSSNRPSLTETIQAFTITGSTTWTCPTGVTEVEVLVVAGGGAGGHGSDSGGGGAGGVIHIPKYTVSPSTIYNVSVGAGGSGAGAKGSNSTFDSIIAYGGGSAQNNDSTKDGGSGAGTTPVNGGEGIPGQGHRGGKGFIVGSDYYRDGGGGGAGGPGSDASTNSEDQGRAGDGGVGLYFPQFSSYGENGWFGGGGGGSGWTRNPGTHPTPGKGGRGGGGSGSLYDVDSPENGTANTGGGGGSANSRGAGGSGIVIIRYFRDANSQDPAGRLRYNTENKGIDRATEQGWNKKFDTKGLESNGLIAYYDPKTHSSGSTVYDLTGNYSGSTINSPTFTDNEVVLTSDTNVGFGSGVQFNTSKPVTITAWVNLEDITGEQAFVGANGNVDSNRTYMGLRGGHYWIGAGTIQRYTKDNTTIKLNTWHNIALVMDGTIAYYFVDGVEVDRTTYGVVGQQDIQVVIGAINTSSGLQYGMNGSIGEVLLYERALSPDEIKINYNTQTNRYKRVAPTTRTTWKELNLSKMANQLNWAYGSGENNSTVEMNGGNGRLYLSCTSTGNNAANWNAALFDGDLLGTADNPKGWRNYDISARLSRRWGWGVLSLISTQTEQSLVSQKETGNVRSYGPGKASIEIANNSSNNVNTIWYNYDSYGSETSLTLRSSSPGVDESVIHRVTLIDGIYKYYQNGTLISQYDLTAYSNTPVTRNTRWLPCAVMQSECWYEYISIKVSD